MQVPDVESGHFGLRGMHERAEKINGQLRLESNLGKGTLVSVAAPLTARPLS
jgi:signal transduction histidine kinase